MKVCLISDNFYDDETMDLAKAREIHLPPVGENVVFHVTGWILHLPHLKIFVDVCHPFSMQIIIQ